MSVLKCLNRLLLSIALLYTQMVYADIPLPTMANNNAPTLSDLQEAQLGKQFFQSIKATGQVIDDPLTTQYINTLGNRLVKAAKTNGQTFHFFVLASPDINAFAGPGGYVGINSALIIQSKNESEVAAVLAHEVTHVTQGHLARSIEKVKGVELSALAGLLASIAIGVYNPNAGAGAMSATMAGAQASILHFTRENEEEADNIGMQVLYDADFDPKSMPDFLETLQRSERLYGTPPEFLSTHPLTSNRIADSQSRASHFSPKAYREDEGFAFLQNRLRVQTTKNSHTLVVQYEKELTRTPANQREAEEYGYANALKSAGLSDKALPILNRLHEQDPANLWISIAWCRAYATNNQFKDALDTFAKLYAADENNYAIVYYYAYTLMENNQPKRALDLLRQHQLDVPDDPIPYELLSQAQGKSGFISDAYQTRAAYLVSMGAPRQALDQLKMAMAVPNNSAINKAKIQAQMDEIQASMKG